MCVIRGTGFLLILSSTCVLLLPTCEGLQLARRDVDATNCTGNASESEDPPAYADCPDPSLCESSSGDNVGLAFGLTFGAGLATTLGALLPFVPCIKRSSTSYLAAGLALAAGVMLYVSFTEIFDKSKFYICCETPDHYYVASTACFFGGILLTLLLDVVVWGLQKLDCGCSCGCLDWVMRRKKEHTTATNLVSFSKHSCNGKALEEVERMDSNALIIPVDSSCSSTPTADSLQEGTEIIARSAEEGEEEGGLTFQPNNDIGGDSGSRQLESRCQTSISDGISVSMVSNTMSEGTNNLTGVSVNELFSNSSLQRMNAIIPETASESLAAESVSHTSVTLPPGGEVVLEERTEGGEGKCGVVELSKDGLLRRNSYLEMVELQDKEESEGLAEFKAVTEVLIHDPKRLKRMGLLTGLAIGLHNFPEGLATFVATLSNPSLGIALAIAIALHNIPEGVCVSMPVYYATGSKWKAFMWAFLSGVSEPIGAFMGWLVLKEVLGPLVYGIFFGIIAGMMVLITLKELLPTAFKFDKSNGIIIPLFLVIGMVVISASLLLFLY